MWMQRRSDRPHAGMASRHTRPSGNEGGIDTIVMSGQLVQALQTIVSRNVSAIDTLIISITQIHGGDTWNVIPEQVVLRGTCRTFLRTTRDKAQARIASMPIARRARVRRILLICWKNALGHMFCLGRPVQGIIRRCTILISILMMMCWHWGQSTGLRWLEAYEIRGLRSRVAAK